MSMLKQFNEQQNLQTAIRAEYDNAQFPNGFGNFLEALVIENLVKDDPSCLMVKGGYTWINEVARGGIRVCTTKHPYVQGKEAGQLIIEGNQDNLDIVQNLLTRHGVIYEGSAMSNIEIKVEYHDTLNPKLWEQGEDEFEMLPDVQEALENASEAFYDYLGLPDLPIEDITVTGSSANYNWTATSDLDLHIVVDMKKAEKKYGKLIVEYFDAQKKLWNEAHDISIRGIPIEFYIQSTAEKHDSTGVYSLKDQKWVIAPKHEPPSIDSSAVKVKAAEWMKKIDKCVKYCEKADEFEALMKKLRDMRKAGLSEAGEFSVENLVFKILRNEGYVDKLADCRTKAFDRDLSMEEEEFEKDDPWEDIGYTRRKPEPQVQPKRTRINLNVPYAHRESAKKAGAKWDAGIRKWYMLVTNEELKRIPSAWR